MTSEAPPLLTDGVVTLRPSAGPGSAFAVEAAGTVAGSVALRELEDGTGELSWSLDPDHRGRGYATRAVRLLIRYAFTTPPEGLGLVRLQARVDGSDVRSIRLARRAGLRNEGVLRLGPRDGARSAVLLARLRDDPEPGDHGGFRALLNSFLPRKRVIAQALVRDREGRVLLCHPTYKDDWDLPGGVVEVGESPQQAVGREVTEELSLTLTIGGLVLADWLPPWGGWDDALCLVFDGGVHEPGILHGAVLQARELRAAEFASPAQVRARCADYTARRIDAALAALAGDGPPYSESGRPQPR